MLEVQFNNGYETEEEQAWFCLTAGWKVTLLPGVTIGQIRRLSDVEGCDGPYYGVLCSSKSSFDLDRLDEPVSVPGSLSELHIGEVLLYADAQPLLLDDARLRRALKKHAVFPDALRDLLTRQLGDRFALHPEPTVWVMGCNGACTISFGTRSEPRNVHVPLPERALDVSAAAKRRLQKMYTGAGRGGWIASFSRFG